STDDEPPGYEPVATVINVRDVFPDAPEKFWDIQYPESVPMLDSLKKSINNLAGFSARDLKGRSFYIATTEPALFTPIYSGSMFSDARRYRTEIVDAECNTQITTIEKSRDEIVQDIIRSIQTDEFFADILCLPFDIQSELIVSGVLMNLKKTPFLNANAEYYNASATEAFTVNGNIFALVSDLTFDPSTVYAVFYNKSLLKQHEIKSPLVAYKNGAWNYDAMFAAAKELAAATADLNSEAGPVYSIGFDRENDDLTNGLFVASGNKYFTKRDYSYPVLNYANDKASKLIEAVQKIFAPEPESGIEAFFGRGEEAQNAEFFSGNVLFSFAKLDIIPDITDMGFDWGILPVPSLDGKYESGFSFADSNALCISVLKGAPNSEACGIVVSSLSAASHRQLKDIYKKEQMTFYLRDVDSVVILGDIISNMSFNQYSAYSSIPEIYRATVGTLKSAANKNGEFLDIYEGSRSALNDFFSSAPSFFARG
ncbi:MAG: extracellular solute-binding protein, partial [Oscillospiraceae bacterium]|nr:extracellular solute-binding protein [Oscillospiraceae bacterium]